MEHRRTEQLEAALPAIREAPADEGVVLVIMRRPEVGTRELVGSAQLDQDVGLVGDCWSTRGSSRTPDGAAHPEMQVTLMGSRAAAAIAGEPGDWAPAGDQFFVDLDLSVANLPPGTRLEVGTALLEVTAVPHRGCGKFSQRFGVDALKFVNSAAGRELNLRGINLRVVRGGNVTTGDTVRKAA